MSLALVLADRIEPQHLADHPLQFAIPVLVPTFVVVALVVAAVVRDRRRGDDDEPASRRAAAEE
jgi:hypothetical protein